MAIWNNRIRTLRESTGITLKEMADKIGVSEATVQRYESGKITKLPYNVVSAYATTFDVSPSYIMGWSDNPTPSDEDTNHTQEILSAVNTLKAYFNKTLTYSEEEQDMIIKFRELDDRGRKHVMDLIDTEHGFLIEMRKKNGES